MHRRAGSSFAYLFTMHHGTGCMMRSSDIAYDVGDWGGKGTRIRLVLEALDENDVVGNV